MNIDIEDDGYCETCFAELLNGIALLICDGCGARFCSQDCHDMYHEDGPDCGEDDGE